MDFEQQVDDLRHAMRELLDVRRMRRQRDAGPPVQIQIAGRDLLGVKSAGNFQRISVRWQRERNAHHRARDQLGRDPCVLGNRIDKQGGNCWVASQRDPLSSDRRPAVNSEQSEAVDCLHQVSCHPILVYCGKPFPC
jgi:hypothetical protein